MPYETSGRTRSVLADWLMSNVLHPFGDLLGPCLNALDQPVALLDRSGVVVFMNRSWIACETATGCCAMAQTLGAAYVEPKQTAGLGASGDDRGLMADVVAGRRQSLRLDCSCGASTRHSRFELYARHIAFDQGGALIVRWKGRRGLESIAGAAPLEVRSASPAMPCRWTLCVCDPPRPRLQ